MLGNWLTLSGLGIMVGFVFTFITMGAIVANTIHRENKVIPKKVFRVLRFFIYYDVANYGILPGNWKQKPAWVLCGIVALFFICGFEWLIWGRSHISNDTIERIIMQTSFPPFFLATWLFPSIWLEKYIRKLTPLPEGTYASDEQEKLK